MAEAGYPALWADGDVFFKNNPFEFMLPMSHPNWDFQVTDEEAANWVNIGFFIQRGSARVAKAWKSVLDILVTKGGWDQILFNDVLDISKQREPEPGQRRKSDMVSPDGTKVHILDKERFRGYMLGFLVPPEAVFIHMPCSDNAVYKDYIAATYGEQAPIHSALRMGCAHASHQQATSRMPTATTATHRNSSPHLR